VPEDRTRPPFRPGGRRPIRLAGHRRRADEAPAGTAPPSGEPASPGEQARPASDLDNAPAAHESAGPEPDNAPAVHESAGPEPDNAPAVHESAGPEPVDVPPAGDAASPAEDARAPGALPAADPLPSADTLPPADPADPAAVAGRPADQRLSAALEPASAGSGLSSPPLAGEPWAGAPPVAAEPIATPAEGSNKKAPGHPGASYPRLRWTLLGLALVAVALLVFVTVLAYNHVQQANRLSTARTDALTAATRAGKPLLSYDYRTLDQQVQMTDPLLTSAYRKKYDATINNVVRTIAVPNKAVLTADVKVAGVRDVTESTASVLLYADLSSTNNQRPDTRVDHTPLVVCMVRSAGTWLVDDVETKLGFQCGTAGSQLPAPAPPAARASSPSAATSPTTAPRAVPTPSPPPKASSTPAPR